MRNHTHQVRGLPQLKALANPLRQRLLAEFAREAQTTKQAAKRLKEKPTRLYHHVHALERVGLLKLVRTSKKRGTTEKYFRAVARRFRVPPALLEAGGRGRVSAAASALTHMLDAVQAEFTRSLAARATMDPMLAETRLFARTRCTVSKANAAALRKKIEAWLEDMCTQNEPEGDSVFSMSLLFYPLAPEDH